jgi:hypothetical protein
MENHNGITETETDCEKGKGIISNNLLFADLDTSWVDKEEKLYSSDMNFTKTTMDSISCYFIYVSDDSSIQKIIKEKERLVQLNNEDVGIVSNRMIQIIQSRRILRNGLKYKIIGLSKYFVDLDASSLHEYCYGDDSDNISKGFFKEFSFLESVVVQPSLLLFHSLNSLYFVFKEDCTVNKRVKSILKTDSSLNTNLMRATKKVRISESLPQHKINTKSNDKSFKNRTNGRTRKKNLT